MFRHPADEFADSPTLIDIYEFMQDVYLAISIHSQMNDGAANAGSKR